MIHYSYQDHQLSATTDRGARMQANKLINLGKATPGSKIEWFRDSDHCKGWLDLNG